MPNYPSPFPLPPKSLVETSIHSSSSVTRAATSSSAKPQPGHDRSGWMVQGFNGGQR